MKPRALLVVAVAMLSVASCKDKPAAPATTKEPGGGAAAAARPALPLPPACEEYRVAIEELAECGSLPLATRETLKKAYEAAAAKWVALPEDSHAGLANQCQAGADAINKTLATCK